LRFWILFSSLIRWVHTKASFVSSTLRRSHRCPSMLSVTAGSCGREKPDRIDTRIVIAGIHSARTSSPTPEATSKRLTTH
jgi:hypothetical protein